MTSSDKSYVCQVILQIHSTINKLSSVDASRDEKALLNEACKQLNKTNGFLHEAVDIDD